MILKKGLAVTALMTLLTIEGPWAGAVEIEKLPKALIAVLGTTSASSAGAGVYYAKDNNGKASRLAFVKKEVYPPDCTHTWVIGIDVASKKVTQVRPVEMKCPHALPTKGPNFLDQFKGKGPADAAQLEDRVEVIAKATGTSKLAAKAVATSIKEAPKVIANIK